MFNNCIIRRGLLTLGIICLLIPISVSIFNPDSWNIYLDIIFSLTLCAISVLYGYYLNFNDIKKKLNSKWLELIIQQCRVLKYQKEKIKKKQIIQQDFCDSVLKKLDNEDLKDYVQQGCSNLVNCLECMVSDVESTLNVFHRFGIQNCEENDCKTLTSIIKDSDENPFDNSKESI